MFFDRPESGELAILVSIDLKQNLPFDDLKEFEELVLSAGGDPVALLTGSRPAPDAKSFIGSGKLDELKQLVAEHCAELVIFNHVLSASQERNLEKALECRVLDRTGLILDIFAQRARTHEGKLQVELAQLDHVASRLIRGWTHLERQKGGIGLRGPGETQLETDRRLIRARIRQIQKKLEKVRKQREQGRRSRTRAEVPTVSLVGYTNAGKSTLFNTLTGADVYAQDQLFATLDPTMRRIDMDSVGSVILADTVGFISHLPHKLVEAFRATLEEASNSDVLLHVIDAFDPERPRNIEQVLEVLTEIKAHELPQLYVYNKTDLLEDMPARLDRNEDGVPHAVWVSAKTGEGMDVLRQAIAELVSKKTFIGTVKLNSAMGSLRAKLHNLNAVNQEVFLEDGSCELELCIAEADFDRVLAAEDVSKSVIVAKSKAA